MIRRAPDPVSLILGLGFTALGLVVLLGRGSVHLELRWLWPVLLVVLAVALLPGIRRPRGAEAGAVPAPVPPPSTAPEPEPVAEPADSGAGGAAEGL